MNNVKKKQIAKSFSTQYAKTDLNIKLNEFEFSKFENGIFAGSMDEKWNIFLVENYMYWARSWTDNCIYKILFERKNKEIELKQLQVSRNPNDYKGDDLEFDLNMFKRMLDYYLTQDE